VPIIDSVTRTFAHQLMFLLQWLTKCSNASYFSSTFLSYGCQKCLLQIHRAWLLEASLWRISRQLVFGNCSAYQRFHALASYQRILVRLYARMFSLWVTTTELVGASLNKDSWMSFTGYAMNFFRCPVKSWWLHYMTRNLEKTRQKRNLAIWVHYAYAWSKALLPLDSRDQVTNFRCRF